MYSIIKCLASCKVTRREETVVDSSPKRSECHIFRDRASPSNATSEHAIRRASRNVEGSARLVACLRVERAAPGPGEKIFVIQYGLCRRRDHQSEGP